MADELAVNLSRKMYSIMCKSRNTHHLELGLNWAETWSNTTVEQQRMFEGFATFDFRTFGDIFFKLSRCGMFYHHEGSKAPGRKHCAAYYGLHHDSNIRVSARWQCQLRVTKNEYDMQNKCLHLGELSIQLYTEHNNTATVSATISNLSGKDHQPLRKTSSVLTMHRRSSSGQKFWIETTPKLNISFRMRPSTDVVQRFGKQPPYG